MKKRILSLILVLAMVFMVACSNGNDVNAGNNANTENNANTNNEQSKATERKEFRMLYSGEYSYNYLAEWYPTMMDLMVDGLVQYNKYSVIVPNAAESWTKSDDGLVYTFKLREGLKWYTSDKKEYADVTADDFIAGAKYLLNVDNNCATANLVYDIILNAKEYYEGTITDFSQVGIKAIDKYTVEYTLKAPCAYFLRLTGSNCFFPINQQFIDEVGDKFGTTADNLLYNGAYILTTWAPEDRQIFELNDKYWDVDNMYISKFTMIYNKDSSLQGELFQRGEIDQASIPTELLQEWVNDVEGKGKWAIQNFYRPSGWFWTINMDPKYEGNGVEDFKTAINNADFRKSLFYAFDRVAVAETLDMFTPENKVIKTITPPNLMYADGVDYTHVGDLKEVYETEQFDVKKALQFKETAMKELEGKVKFPITLLMPYNSGNGDFVNAVQVFQQQMENALGKDYINIILQAEAPTSFNTRIYAEGLYSIGYNFWGADYADPASFTDIFNPNLTISKRYGTPWMAEGYKDENGKNHYVNLLEEALKENSNLKTRYEKLAKAEAFLINEALVMPNTVGDGVYWLCKLDPHEGNTSDFARSTSMYKGKKVMDKPMTREEAKTSEEQYLKEKEEAMKNAKNQD